MVLGRKEGSYSRFATAVCYRSLFGEFVFDILSPMRKSILIRLAAGMFLSGALWLAYTQGQQPAKQELVKLKDDLYVIHNDFVPGNTTALITNAGVVLV